MKVELSKALIVVAIVAYLSVMLLIAFYDEEFEKELTQDQIKASSTIQDLYNLAIA